VTATGCNRAHTWSISKWRALLCLSARGNGAFAADLEPFENAYAKADGARFDRMSPFCAANRINACSTRRLMEQQRKR
jgi:hypothetical protein